MWLEMLVEDFHLRTVGHHWSQCTHGSGSQETWNLVLAQEHALRDDYGLNE